MKTCPFCLQEKEEFGRDNQLLIQHLENTRNSGYPTVTAQAYAVRQICEIVDLDIITTTTTIGIIHMICSDCNNEIHYNYDRFYFKMSILHS
jgi:hypothetical protein